MAAKKKTSSGSTPRSKKIVKSKMKRTMEEYKGNKLKSGRSGKKVKSRKQAIAIGLSEARRSGADIPKSPSKRKASKRKTSKKT
jgi:Family of unknown function (DUF6496)